MEPEKIDKALAGYTPQNNRSQLKKIADYLEECGFKDVVLVGELFAATRHSYQSYPDVTALIAELQREKPCGKTILIKGSNGIKLSSVVEYL